jgi:hypothetical protein
MENYCSVSVIYLDYDCDAYIRMLDSVPNLPSYIL